MNALDFLIQKLQTLPLEVAGMDAVEELLPLAADLNTQQLQHGLRADGTTISPEYQNPGYASLKASMNPLAGAGIPDLSFTGAFYSNIEARTTPRGFMLVSMDVKTGTLVAKYGESIIGLSKDSIREYLTYFQPLVVLRLKEHFR
jgi:hypothetical protein